MRHLLLLSLCSLLPAETLTQGERERAVGHMQATRKLFLDSVAGVTPEQWMWKPAPEVWSIAEVAEHIAIYEDTVFEHITKRVLGNPANPSKKGGGEEKDAKLLTKVVDSSHKVQTAEGLRPAHRWKTKEELIAHFNESRDRNIKFVETTQEDLRAHFSPHPLGSLDAYN